VTIYWSKQKYILELNSTEEDKLQDGPFTETLSWVNISEAAVSGFCKI